MGGLALPWTGSPLLDRASTLLWLVGITNAVNLLDNMDGLAAGVTAIAAAFLAANFFASGQMAEFYLLAMFAGTLIGFLVFNIEPGIHLHGRLRLDVYRFLSRKFGPLACFRRTFDEFALGSCGSGAASGDPHLRHDARYGHAETLGTGGLSGGA